MKTEVWYWEDDPDAEEIIEALTEAKIDFSHHTLEPEVPSATPYIVHQGKTYWDFDEFLLLLRETTLDRS